MNQTDAQRQTRLKQKAELSRLLRSGAAWNASDRSPMPATGFVYWVSSRPLSYFLATLLLIGGAYVESADFLSGAFPRAGAVLVAAALAVLWLWVHYSNASQVSRSLLDKLEPVKGGKGQPDFATVFKHVSRSNPNIPADALLEIAWFVFDRLSYGPKNQTLLSEYSNRLAVVQVELALIGTVVWAFGDMLPL